MNTCTAYAFVGGPICGKRATHKTIIGREPYLICAEHTARLLTVHARHPQAPENLLWPLHPPRKARAAPVVPPPPDPFPADPDEDQLWYCECDACMGCAHLGPGACRRCGGGWTNEAGCALHGLTPSQRRARMQAVHQAALPLD